MMSRPHWYTDDDWDIFLNAYNRAREEEEKQDDFLAGFYPTDKLVLVYPSNDLSFLLLGTFDQEMPYVYRS